MANQFVAKNGLISNGNVTVSGSIIPTGTLQGSASYASTASNATTSSYASASFNGIHAWATWTVAGTTVTVVGGLGLTVTRLSLGLYSFIFQSPYTVATYAIAYSGYTGSVATPTTLTGSSETVFAKTINGFTMSLAAVNTPLVRADAMSASLMTIGY